MVTNHASQDDYASHSSYTFHASYAPKASYASHAKIRLHMVIVIMLHNKIYGDKLKYWNFLLPNQNNNWNDQPTDGVMDGRTNLLIEDPTTELKKRHV